MSHLPCPRRLPRAAAIVLAVALLTTAAPPPVAGADPAPAYRPPVDAPVHDPFRAPEGPYGPGNRGIEYDTPAGVEVRAAGPGRVTFAGWVAGTLHVTVLHGDGVRTTVSHLAEVRVVVGQEVSQGEVVGTTAARLHFGARRGDAYFDPASLFGAGPAVVRLVPFDVPPGLGIGGERSAISQLLRAGGAIVDVAEAGAGAAVTVGEAAATSAVDALRFAAHYAPYLDPVLLTGTLLLRGVDAGWAAWERANRPCTSDGAPVPAPGERVALLVAGFGSSSSHASVDDVDVDALGYDAADVLRFSYAGGRIPDGDVQLPGVPSTPYDPADSHQDLRRSGARLADLVEDVVSARPGIPVDLIAHSQGGVVARLALIELARRHGTAWLEHVGLLATLGTPHEGAVLATAGAALGSSVGGTLALEALDAVADVGTGATSMAQLAETSDVIAELADHPIPAEVPAISIAARGDLVVPAPRTDAPGAVEATVPISGLDAHSALPGDPRTTREVALARAGLPPRCVGLAEALADELVGEAIATAESAAGSALWVASAGTGVAPVP